jgi:hypothetical protein
LFSRTVVAAERGRLGRADALLWTAGLSLQHSGPALIDVVTDGNALSLPSHIEPAMIVGFGLTMGKLVLTGHVDEVVETIEANILHTGEALDTI